MNGIVRQGALVATLLLLAAGGAGASAPSPVLSGSEARVAVRSGDPAPVAATFGKAFGCRLAAPQWGADLGPVDDPFLFADAGGTALFLGTRFSPSAPLAYVGQEVAGGGGRIASLCGGAIGNDGTIAFRAGLADGREGIFLSDLSRAVPAPVIVAGGMLDLRDGPVTVSLLSDVAVDAAGEIVAAVDTLEGVSAIIKLPGGGAAPVVLIQTGDPLGGPAFMRATTSPAISSSGLVAFTASRDDGSEAVGMVVPGSAPFVIFAPTAPPGQPAPSVSIADPAIDDAGDVAFLSASLGQVRLQRFGAGGVSTLAAPGRPAPGGGTFTEITDLDPSINYLGEITFGAVRSNGRSGVYIVGPMFPSGAIGQLTVIEEGMSFPATGMVTRVPNRDGQGSPTFRSLYTVMFAAEGSTASGLFFRQLGVENTPPSDPTPVALAGTQIGGTARFASFLDDGPLLQYGGPSPAVGPGPAAGSVIFDARVTGGERGLFVRDRAGVIVPITQSAGVGGGPVISHFDGDSLAFHSMNGEGILAFLGAEPDIPVGPRLGFYYGVPSPPGTGSPLSLSRRLGTGDCEPGGGTRTVDTLWTPSRVNAMGQVAVPVRFDDGASVLLGYDGVAFFSVVAPGDPAPGGGIFTDIFTGSFFLGMSVAPPLDDIGQVLFGGVTSFGEFALFKAPLAPNGGRSATRVAGQGDIVDGGRLSPFEPQAVDADSFGRVAFSAIYDDDADFGLFLKEAGVTTSVALKFDLFDDLGFVASVPPRLALAGEGRLAYSLRFFDGSEAILLREASLPPPVAGSAGVSTFTFDSAPSSIIAAAGQASPDGGTYRRFQAGFRPTARLSSDKRGTLAFAAMTDAGPQEIVLFGESPRLNSPPIARAGQNQTVECGQIEGQSVQLDGTGSIDQDGDPLTYRWTGPFGTAEGAQPFVHFPLGISTATLVVNDGQLDSPAATVTIEVRDTAPPAIIVAGTPAVLWPADRRLVEAGFTVQVSDVCDPFGLSVTLAGVAAFEGGRALVPGPWVAGAAIGTDDRSLQLRAERGGGSTGRTYVVTYRVADRSGNSALGSTSVIVPHDQRR